MACAGRDVGAAARPAQNPAAQDPGQARAFQGGRELGSEASEQRCVADILGIALAAGGRVHGCAGGRGRGRSWREETQGRQRGGHAYSGSDGGGETWGCS